MSVILYDGKEIYKGCVMRIWEHNGSWDSDFYATVWDEKTNSVIDYEYDTTRFAGGGNAVVDITKENLIKANKYLAKKEYEGRVEKINSEIKLNVYATVVKGRKVAKGTKGKVIGIYKNDYDKYNDKVRLLLDNGEKVYTYIKNLKPNQLTEEEKNELKKLICEKYKIENF